MKILVHVCCAPCSVGIFSHLKQGGNRVAGYFYNPNIHPKSEYLLRQKTSKEFLRKKRVKFIGSDYRPGEYFKAIGKNHARLEKTEPGSEGRCLRCWRLRLEKTAKKAKELGFEAFCSTLQTSHFQDQRAIERIGKSLQKKHKIEFIVDQFFHKPGSKLPKKQKGFYRQNYCGCVYSLLEIFEQKMENQR